MMQSAYYALHELPPVLSALSEIPEPPEGLYVQGTLPPEGSVLLAVVGSRKWTSYGRDAVKLLIEGLAGTNTVVVSGLALGIDSIAHRAALDSGLPTIAVPGSGLNEEVLYPREHARLARAIVERKGALVSEYEPGQVAAPWTFPKRNRLMAGMSKAVLVVEAAERSGTLITARLALDYGRDVLVVPGSIFSPSSKGIHWLLRQGATPVTTPDELRDALGLPARETAENGTILGLSLEEERILEALSEAKTRSDIALETELALPKLNAALTLLEIKGIVKEEGGLVRRAR